MIRRLGGVDPRRAPQFPAVIDWAHPLARGLTLLYVPSQSLTTDLVGYMAPVFSTFSNACIVDTPYGLAAGGFGQVVNTLQPVAMFPPGDFTIVLNMYSLLFGSGGYRGFGIEDTTSRYSPGIAFGFGGYYSTASLIANQGTGGAGAAWTSGPESQPESYTSTVEHYPALMQAAATLKVGGNYAFYYNTALGGTGVGPTTPPIYLYDMIVRIGDGGVGGAGYAKVALYNRVLPRDEINWSTVEPFAMLKPKTRRLYMFGKQTSGGGAAPAQARAMLLA